MIDTICLLIPKDKIISLSGASSWDLYSRTDYYQKYVRNPSKKEKETRKYLPRLTGYKRRFSGENVRIEFSVPKLLYLNNLDELEEKDFNEVIDKLQQRLRDMDVIVEKPILENASVSSIHFSKNILLQDGYTANYLISEMNKVDLRKNFDFAKTRFINDGQSLYAHTTAHQLVIYDKIADLAKDKNRAIDKEQPPYQRDLFSKLNGKDRPQEIIRFEIRINQKQKLNKILEELGYQKNLTFKEIFNNEISKKVVTDYWKKLIKERSLGIFSISPSVKNILQIIFLENKSIKPKQAIYLLGLFMLARDEYGMRQLRTILSKRSNNRTWYRIVKDLQQASTLITQNKIQDWVTQIDKALEDYKSYKIKNYETS
jgi:translation elongation factor EF-G